MPSRWFNLLPCFFFIGASALANDSTAELKTGGLILLKSSKIEMQSEDLLISSKEIKIKYVFLNDLPTDIATIIAFPMPRISMSSAGGDIEIPNENSDNFLDFSTSVNGRPISARTELRAYQDDHEVTSILKAARVPLTPNRQQTQSALDRLPKFKKKELIRDNLVDAAGPRWSLATTYYFNLVFPAGKETRIEHKYRPSVGSSNVTSLGDPNLISKSWIKEKIGKYCIDDATLNVITSAKKPPHMDYGSPFTEERISYILHTGANWMGPIANFHLAIDKGSPENLISLCGYGVTESTPTLVEFSKSNFTPNNDIDIIILKPFEKSLHNP